jgi:RIO-like serine/threonine protein kinase
MSEAPREPIRKCRSIVEVVREGNSILKIQPAHLCDTERWCLEQMAYSGYVPAPCERVHREAIRMPYIPHQSVTDEDAFMDHYQHAMRALREAGIRHGDLTIYSVLVYQNRPILIDFAESRFWYDPMPDKRHEGDAYWLWRTMRELCR